MIQTLLENLNKYLRYLQWVYYVAEEFVALLLPSKIEGIGEGHAFRGTERKVLFLSLIRISDSYQI